MFFCLIDVARKMQTSSMKAWFQIAECSFSCAKIIGFPIVRIRKKANVLCNRSRNRFQNLQTFAMADKIKNAKKPHSF